MGASLTRFEVRQSLFAVIASEAKRPRGHRTTLANLAFRRYAEDFGIDHARLFGNRRGASPLGRFASLAMTKGGGG